MYHFPMVGCDSIPLPPPPPPPLDEEEARREEVVDSTFWVEVGGCCRSDVDGWNDDMLLFY